MHKALSYNFKLNDLNKYSSKLRMKDLDWKFDTTVLGKFKKDGLLSELESEEEEEELPKKIRFVKGSLFYTLYKQLLSTDWIQTNIYTQYQK